MLIPAITSAQADHTMQPGMKMAADAAMTEGEIRKVDKDLARLTIKHGPIRNLDMGAMTMVFHMKDRLLLDKVKVGDKVHFMVAMEAGKMIITDLQPAR